MFCSNCGEKLTAKAKFCAACGAPHGESGSAPTKKAASSSPKLEPFGNTGFLTNLSFIDATNFITNVANQMGLRSGTSPNGVFIQGKAFGHNGAAALVVLREVDGEMCTSISFLNETNHFGPGFGKLTRDISNSIVSEFKKLS